MEIKDEELKANFENLPPHIKEKMGGVDKFFKEDGSTNSDAVLQMLEHIIDAAPERLSAEFKKGRQAADDFSKSFPKKLAALIDSEIDLWDGMFPAPVMLGIISKELAVVMAENIVPSASDKEADTRHEIYMLMFRILGDCINQGEYALAKTKNTTKDKPWRIVKLEIGIPPDGD